MEYGLIGKTLVHSYSKEIHGLIGDYEYQLVSLAPEKLDRFMTERLFKGINVTIPYKQAVIPYCQEISDRAGRIGSVNTVVNRDGVLWGYNTDYDGFLYMAGRAGISFTGAKVLILGSGGTRLTAQAAAEEEGAASVTVVSRKGPVTYDQLSSYYHYDILINTTPVGMYPHTEDCPVELERFTNLRGVLDVIYNPLETCLVKSAGQLGIPAANGLYMLVVQAVKAHELFFQKTLPEDMYENIYRAFLKNMRMRH